MPPLTRWYIKSALGCLVLGLVLGVLQLVPGAPAVLAVAGPAVIHLLVVGWITQMIFGVAYWMFPKFTTARPRGDDAIAMATFVLLNGGLLLRVIVEPVHTLRPSSALGAVLAIAALAQALAAVGFVRNTWPRVKEK
jgi:hypothetical protein